jgi:isopropylmalate/homocitrate/citramalate synthase
MDINTLIHDWNQRSDAVGPRRPIEFDDETLRDGLQNPSVRDPDVGQKIELIHLMDQLGIHTVNLGLPGAGGRAREDIVRLAVEIGRNKLRIGANVACRTVITDIEPVVEMSQRAGIPIEVCAFIGSSPIRQFAEDWTLEQMLKHSREAIQFCRKHNLPCMFVTEDTTRAHPDTIRALFGQAMELGAERLCVCDTVGHATPHGAQALIRFVKGLVQEIKPDTKVDWHGHRDRNLDIANCIAAVEAGVDRVHGAALGIGERAGNAAMDLLLVNFKLLGWIDQDLHKLPEYTRKVAEAVGVTIPHNYPVFGSDAFETGTGVHAAAVIKAFKKGSAWLADRVYSGVPAGEFGLQQKIGVGPMSGKSNVIWCLEKLGVPVTEERVQRVLAACKASKRLLSDQEIKASAG